VILSAIAGCAVGNRIAKIVMDSTVPVCPEVRIRYVYDARLAQESGFV
jgi:hypothetical protein